MNCKIGFAGTIFASSLNENWRLYFNVLVKTSFPFDFLKPQQLFSTHTIFYLSICGYLNYLWMHFCFYYQLKLHVSDMRCI